MALRERIYSLETEYGIQFYPTGGSSRPPADEQVRTLLAVVREEVGALGCDFLLNGSKAHLDVGHPEWALPECRSPHEAVVYDQAADQSFRLAVPEAQRRLANEGYQGQLLIFKNNTDAAGHTFGCHENYQMQRDAVSLTGVSFQRYLARCLVPFLVTRQIYCGAGRLMLSDDESSATFRLSQRADFIETVVSKATTEKRAIVNFSREEEPLADQEFRRLHLIVGDTNLSPWATWMKLGTNGLLLRLIEDLYLQDLPLLADPVHAIREVAADLSGRQLLPLRDGRTITAVEIQWRYYNTVSDYLKHFGASEEEENILAEWEQALADFTQDPMRLGDRADWAIKKKFMDAQLQVMNSEWQDTPMPRASLGALKGIEARYHDLSAKGLYSRFRAAQDPDDLLVTDSEIERARYSSPPYTRAAIRGQAVARMRETDTDVNVNNWGDIHFNEERIRLDDPLDFAIPAWSRSGKFINQIEEALAEPDLDVRLRATHYLGWSRTETALHLLTQIIEDEAESEPVRAMAVLSLGDQRLEQGRNVLLDCLQSPIARIRRAAESALYTEKEHTDSDPDLEWLEEPVEDTSNLVNFLN